MAQVLRLTQFSPIFYLPASGFAARTKEDIVLDERVDVAQKAAPSAPQMQGADTTAGGSDLLSLILTSLDDDKAEEIVTIPLAGKSEFADHMVIASGRSTRQVVAMAEKMSDKIKSLYGQSPRIEGKDSGDWVLIDAGDVIVHIFRPEVREFYQLEKMWTPAGSAKS